MPPFWHIVVVTPTTLLATLRTIADNAARLYDKFVGFVEDLEKIGNGIDSLHKTYDAVMNKLSRWRGNLVRQMEGFRALGWSRAIGPATDARSCGAVIGGTGRFSSTRRLPGRGIVTRLSSASDSIRYRTV